MSDMKCPIKCPICGEMLQKYGEVDPDTGTSIVLGANCPKCGIGNSDIKLWQELIRTRKALDVAVDALKNMNEIIKNYEYGNGLYYALDGHDTMLVAEYVEKALCLITALEQKE